MEHSWCISEQSEMVSVCSAHLSGIKRYNYSVESIFMYFPTVCNAAVITECHFFISPNLFN